MKKKLRRRSSTKKATLKNFAHLNLKYLQENICVRVSFNKVAGRDSNKGFSCEYCEILKNTNFEEHMRTAASETC